MVPTNSLNSQEQAVCFLEQRVLIAPSCIAAFCAWGLQELEQHQTFPSKQEKKKLVMIGIAVDLRSV